MLAVGGRWNDPRHFRQRAVHDRRAFFGEAAVGHGAAKPLASGLYRSSMAAAGRSWLTWRSAGIFSISARQCRKAHLVTEVARMFW